MATVKEHYDEVLSDVYSWMAGGFDSAIERYAGYFADHDIKPRRSGVAFDLGAGCGFQSIPLARAGFSVTAVDTDARLLDELAVHAAGLPIRTVQDDLVDFDRHAGSGIEVIVCMTDTLLHLESGDKVITLFRKVHAALEEGGRFLLTYRDLSSELQELDRIIPVRSDENIIFTCFLEYEPETVKVHDLVYKRQHDKWSLGKSYYRKLRLSRDWVDRQLYDAGFTLVESSMDAGLVSTMAIKHKKGVGDK
jgi:cyclopropane fatty-acyl-phospholipid synthase-like methyltransferase